MRLTPTSYIVLGLLDRAGEASPYDLKGMVAAGVGNFWSLQHAQLYSETARLAQAGYLTEEQEERGRRRKRYRITQAGRESLREWRSLPTRAFTELRDPGLLKLFFDADPGPLANEQLEVHRQKLEEYERLEGPSGSWPAGMRLALQAGIGHEREWIRFWERVKEEGG